MFKYHYTKYLPFTEKLTADLRLAFPGRSLSCSSHGDEVVVACTTEMDSTDQATILGLINAADPETQEIYAFQCELEEEVETIYGEKLYTDFVYTKDSTDYTFHGDEKSIKNIEQALITVSNLPDVIIPFYTRNGWVNCNKDDFIFINGLLLLHKQNLYQNSRVHKEAIQALTTLSELQAYDTEAGWYV